MATASAPAVLSSPQDFQPDRRGSPALTNLVDAMAAQKLEWIHSAAIDHGVLTRILSRGHGLLDTIGPCPTR